MGRRKIEIKMVKDTNTRQVTFSKRRTGLFKKANELSILCGAEVAIVVFSPGNKPYSFGHPGVDAVAAKYLINRDEEADPDADADAVVVAADGDGDGGDHDDEEGGRGSASSGDDESDDHVADDDHVARLNKMLAEVMEQVREAEKEAAACEGELGLRMALTGRGEFQELRDAHVGLKGLVKERLGLLEAVETLLLLAEKPVVGIPKKRRRTN